ncbi:long-subunit fatty acid transport protein [Mesonia hippocampi]|uniref:Long-subunit fatty acid transport protein n=1 Tax=Mesonia hippocampi TaxID=1628250 RepID=A0A840EYZ3_9FLAO|nr:outer membrane beta-barrel protein [Mesonia hippocampi]MBB4119254.1 long-subunit fatty acid transport protein [Mesonia hippocampi]
MKKITFLLSCFLFLAINLLQAQEKEETSKFNIIGYGGIGYGIVENNNQPNYNLNSNNGEILLNYKLNQKFGVATGIGFNELSGNGFNSAGNFYHERSLLKIPALVTLNAKIAENIKIVGNLGFYTQTIIKDEYRFLNNTQKDIYEGWNFGAQIGLGFLYELFDNFYAGINLNSQSDFNKFKTAKNAVINDKQKIKSQNSIGIMFFVNL